MDRFSNILKQRLEPTQSVQAAHPSSDTLIAFIELGLTGSQREAVLTHLSICTECREAVALATPEATTVNTPAANYPLSSAFHFPAALRWASLGAALAVAVGVGVIAYEHETPVPRQAALSVAHEKANPAASAAPTTNEDSSSNSLQSSTSKSPHAPSRQPVAEVREPGRERTLAKKRMEGREDVLGRFSAPSSVRQSKDEYVLHLKALPAAPEAQPTLADKRDTTPLTQAVRPSPVSPSASVIADGKAVQDANGGVAGAKPSAAFPDSAIVGGAAGLVESQPAPSKSLTAVAVGAPAAKTKRIYGRFGFVHWTISAAGKLQRRATDGTLTIVEPLPGAIIRAVAAEGIEVWAGGSQSAPSAQNSQPRSMLFHSSDAGETWKSIEGPWQGPITRVNLAGLGSLTVITSEGTWTTGDGGKSWSKP